MSPLGSLIDEGADVLKPKLKPATWKQYNKGVNTFLAWALEADVGPVTIASLDDVFAQFLKHFAKQYKGRFYARAKNAYYGLQAHIPTSKNLMPQSKALIKTWAKHQNHRSWPPLSWSLAVVIAVAMAAKGRPDMAVMGLLSFHCLLRVGEGVGLHVADFVDCDDPRMDPDFPHHGGLRLRFTKTGAEQFVTILDRQVAELLRLYIVRRRTETVGETDPKLFIFTAAAYRREFKTVCAQLGLSPDYVPHSSRHGGATRLRLVFGWSVEDVMERGRWAASKSARHYIQQGRAMACSIEVPANVAAMGRRLSRHLCACVFGA